MCSRCRLGARRCRSRSDGAKRRYGPRSAGRKTSARAGHYFLKTAIRAGFEPSYALGSPTDSRTKRTRWGGSIFLGETNPVPRLKTGTDKLQSESTSSARRVFRPSDRGPRYRPFAVSLARRFAPQCSATLGVGDGDCFGVENSFFNCSMIVVLAAVRRSWLSLASSSSSFLRSST
jgi:hypothetical protein